MVFYSICGDTFLTGGCCFFCWIFIFLGQIMYPEVFFVVLVYDWQFYDLIQVQYEIDCQHRPFQNECGDGSQGDGTHHMVTVSQIRPKRVSPPALNMPPIVVVLIDFPAR